VGIRQKESNTEVEKGVIEADLVLVAYLLKNPMASYINYALERG